MCYTFQLTAKRFPLTATQIVTEDVNSLCRPIHSPHKNPGILGLLTDLMGANYQCRPVSSQCCGLSPNLGFLTGMMPAPVYQHWATARTRSTGPPLSLRRRRPRPLFWPWVGEEHSHSVRLSVSVGFAALTPRNAGVLLSEIS